MRVANRAIFVPSPGNAAAHGSAWYVRKDGPEMVSVHGLERRSDLDDARFERRSLDNGRTWTEPREIELLRKTEAGTYRVSSLPGFVDPATDRLIRLSNRGLLPTDNAAEGASAWSIWYEVSSDGGRAWSEAKPICEDGRPADHPFEPIVVGRNAVMLGDQTCVPLALPDGEILVPCQVAEVDADGKLYQPHKTPFYAGYVLIGKWADAQTISWTISRPVRHSPEVSTRGAFEPTIARVPDGRILMVLRGSNMRETELPGRRWYSVSSDDGRTWSEVKPWTYASGESFYSPSSCSQLLAHSNGGLYWIGNICQANPDGNLPRYPLVVGEVDQKSLLLKKETVIVIDDRREGENERMCLSNFYAHEDRESHEIVVYVPRWFTHGEGSKDWTADTWRIGVRVES